MNEMIHCMNCTLCDKPAFNIRGDLYDLMNLDQYVGDRVHDVTADFDKHDCNRNLKGD